MKKNPIEEARRYVDNAKKALNDNGKLLYMNYDGVQSKNTCDDGFRLANDIIDRCEKLLAS